MHKAGEEASISAHHLKNFQEKTMMWTHGKETVLLFRLETRGETKKSVAIKVEKEIGGIFGPYN